MSQEIELKLSLPPNALKILQAHPLIRSAPLHGKTCTLDNIYYDTPELNLKKQKIALRTRRQGKTWRQTVKCASPSTAGLTQRPEWEYPYAGTFDFSRIDNPEIVSKLTHVRDELVPILQTRFRRETRRYSPDKNISILIMTDTGHIRAGEQTARICELELELEKGHPVDLIKLAKTLTQDIPLYPADQSKAERGYQLFLKEQPAPVPRNTTALSTRHTPLEAFRLQALASLQHWQANTEMLHKAYHARQSIVYGPIIEEIRLALQHLQTLLHFFADTLPPGFSADWKQRLHGICQSYDEACEANRLLATVLLPPVLTTDILPLSPALSETLTPALPKLTQKAEQHRLQLCLNAIKASQNTEHRTTSLALAEALYQFSETNTTRDETPSLKPFVLNRLALQRKSLLQQFKSLVTSPPPIQPEALHHTLKTFLHSLSLLASLLPARKGSAYQAKLSATLNTLNHYTALECAETPFQNWNKHIPPLRAPIAFTTGWRSAQRTGEHPHVLQSIQHFLAEKTPWKKKFDR